MSADVGAKLSFRIESTAGNRQCARCHKAGGEALIRIPGIGRICDRLRVAQPGSSESAGEFQTEFLDDVSSQKLSQVPEKDNCEETCDRESTHKFSHGMSLPIQSARQADHLFGIRV